MHIIFYHSPLCPRCHLAGRTLKEIAREHGDIEIEEIDVFKRPLETLRRGVRMIPALQIDSRVLSGLYLKRKHIHQFIDNS